jgi:serine/threonine protein phosphatase PrpC
MNGATTMVMAAIAAGGAVVASVGDSEILAIDATGPARSLAPVDHLPSQTNVLLSWLDGVEEFEPHTVALPSLPYRLCLVTDGVAGTLSYETIADLVRSVQPAEAARLLVRQARAGGSRDDATASSSATASKDLARFPSPLRRLSPHREASARPRRGR